MDLSQQAAEEHLNQLGQVADADMAQLRAQAEAVATDYNLSIYGRDPFVYRALVDAILQGMVLIVQDYEQGRRKPRAWVMSQKSEVRSDK